MSMNVTIGGNATGFFTVMNKAKAEARTFAASIGGTMFGGLQGQLAALVSVGAITQLTRQTIAFAGSMRDLADTIGVNVEWLQKMRMTAVKAGSSENDLVRFMYESNNSRSAAVKDPNGKEAMALQRLGFSQGEISNLPVQDFMEKIFAAFKNGSSAQVENDVREIGGKAAFQLMAAFQAGIDENADVMSENLVDALDEIGDMFDELSTSLMVTFAPAIVMVGDAIKETVDQISVAQRGLGEVLGSAAEQARLWVTGDEASATDRKAKYRSQLDRRVAAGEITQEQADKKWKQAGNADVSATTSSSLGRDISTGESEAMAEIERRKADSEKARQAKLEARRRREKSAPDFDATPDKKEKQTKEIGWAPDEYSKMGMFSRSSVWLNPTLGNDMQRENLRVLKNIERNTGRKDENPFT